MWQNTGVRGGEITLDVGLGQVVLSVVFIDCLDIENNRLVISHAGPDLMPINLSVYHNHRAR